MLGNKFMQRVRKRLLPCIVSAALLAGMAPATGASATGAGNTLPEQAAALYNNSYRSLADRITDRGYAPTSLTGAYQGMFIRDTSIQIMAHTAYGETDLSRSLLDYLLSYHVGFGAERAAHVIPNFQDEAYGNSFIPLRGDEGEQPPEASPYYDCQEDFGIGLYLINAPEHAAATGFIPETDSIRSVGAYLTKTADTDTVRVSIRTDVQDPDSAIASTAYTFGETPNGWQEIPFEKAVSVTPGQKYYLVLQATEDSGGVVWYGSVSKQQQNWQNGYNYDIPAFGGWVEQAQFPAFRIGDARKPVTEGYFIAQNDAATALFRLNAPANGGGQTFIPQTDTVRSVKVFLSKTTDQDTVVASIRTDINDPESAIASQRYTFGESPNGWQEIVFDEPVSVLPGEKYYLTLQATENSGNVVWFGTTSPTGEMQHAWNYDLNAIGGWQETGVCTAFEVTTSTSVNTPFAIAQEFAVRGDRVDAVKVTADATEAGGSLVVEIRSDYDDPATVLGTAAVPVASAGSQEYMFAFEESIPVEPLAPYYLVLTAKDCPGNVNWKYEVAQDCKSYVYGGSDWREQTIYQFQMTTYPELSGAYKAPLAALGGAASAVQEISAPGTILTGARVLLGRTEAAAGTVRASLYKGYGESGQLIDACETDASALSMDGDWVNFTFGLPLEGTQAGDSYFLKIEAPEAPAGSVVWYGTREVDSLSTWMEDGSGSSAIEGELGFDALRSEIHYMSNFDQVDGNYMLLHAWAQYAAKAPDTAEDRDFIERSFPVVKRFADYYLDNGYISDELNLMMTPSLEHSREGRYWHAYDLITNVFASQALHELSEFAQSRGDEADAAKWKAAADRLVKGVNEHLTTEVDGVKIYAELYDIGNDMRFIPGMSWVNWAPMAAEWYAADFDLLQNTYDIYQKYGTEEYDGYPMLDACMDMETGGFGNHVIGKGFAWEMMFNRKMGHTERLDTMVDFVLSHSTPNGVYPETWVKGGHFSDIGNQEHCAWQVYAWSVAFPELTLHPPIVVTGAPESGSTRGAVTLTAEKEVTWSVNGTEVERASTTIQFRDEGTYTVTARADGAVSETIVFSIDRTAPVLTASVEHYGYTNQDVYFNTDEEVTFYNGSDVIGEGTELTLTESGTYNIRATDKAGNHTAFYRVTIMKEAPVLTGAPEGVTRSNIAIRSNVKVLFIVNGVEADDYAYGLKITEEGKYTVKAVDMAGNESEVSFEIDRTKPTFTASVPSGQATGKDITLTSNEVVDFVIDGVTVATGTEYTISRSGLTVVRIFDVAGNYGGVYKANIDKSAPVLSAVVEGTNKAVENGATVKQNVTVKTSKASYFIVNDGEPTARANFVKLKASGTYTVKAVDMLGNVSEVFTVTIAK